MKNKLLFIILVLTLISSVLMIAVPIRPISASPGELHVGSGQTYSTIQGAINAASPGDIVIVHAGTYSEQLTIDKAITLQAQTGSIPIINVSSYTTGNGITITADNVIIDGFNIIGIPTNESGTDEEVYYADAHSNKWQTINIGGSNSAGGISNVTVKNCQFTVNSGDKGHIAMYVHDDCLNVTFSGNTVNGYLRGIYAHNNIDNLIVRNNEFNLVSFQRDNMYLWGVTFNYTVGQGVTLNYGKNYVVTDNVFNGPGTFPVRGQDPNGICNVYAIADFISYFISSPTTDYVVNFSGNEITNFYLGMATFAAGGTMSNNNVNGNLIGIQIGQYSAVWATGAVEAVQIINNNIKNNMRGIWIQNFVADGIGAHHNHIVGNTEYGVINEDPENDIFDARFNWWGDESGPSGSGPGLGDAVSNNVVYSPWLGNIADLNWDNKVDIRDVATAAVAFGEFVGRPRWNPIADVNNDGKVDIRDIVIVASNFGWIMDP